MRMRTAIVLISRLIFPPTSRVGCQNSGPPRQCADLQAEPNLCTPHANFGTPHAKKLSEASAYGVVIEKNVTDLRAELHAAAA